MWGEGVSICVLVGGSVVPFLFLYLRRPIQPTATVNLALRRGNPHSVSIEEQFRVCFGIVFGETQFERNLSAVEHSCDVATSTYTVKGTVPTIVRRQLLFYTI
jgi:hypothetical protein